MTTELELVMYIRTRGCPFMSTARLALARMQIPYREINIDTDEAARAWLLETVGFLSVPTLVLAHPGEDRPYAEPAALPPGSSPRGIDRGSVLTEPNSQQLAIWLEHHGFVPVG